MRIREDFSAFKTGNRWKGWSYERASEPVSEIKPEVDAWYLSSLNAAKQVKTAISAYKTEGQFFVFQFLSHPAFCLEKFLAGRVSAFTYFEFFLYFLWVK